VAIITFDHWLIFSVLSFCVDTFAPPLGKLLKSDLLWILNLLLIFTKKVWPRLVFRFSAMWMWLNWKVGWKVTLMERMLRRMWLAKNAKTGDDWWSWKFEEAAILPLLFPCLLFVCFCGVLLFAGYELRCVALHVSMAFKLGFGDGMCFSWFLQLCDGNASILLHGRWGGSWGWKINGWQRRKLSTLILLFVIVIVTRSGCWPTINLSIQNLPHKASNVLKCATKSDGDATSQNSSLTQRMSMNIAF